MTNKSDGSSASYYELPKGCTQLQDLISHRNMNAQDGEIFRAIYRKGRASHSDELRDARKVLFYAQAEVERLEANALVTWPTEGRIDAIGQNGNDGEHYQPLPALGTFLPEHGGVVVSPPDADGLSLIVRSGPDVPISAPMGCETAVRLMGNLCTYGWAAPSGMAMLDVMRTVPGMPDGRYWVRRPSGGLEHYLKPEGAVRAADGPALLHVVKRVKL